MNSINHTAPLATATTAIITAKYRVTGQVQNVGFRHYLAQAAARLTVRGWAKNENDGSLIVLVRGDEDNVQEMLLLMQQGPAGAEVSSWVELIVDDNEVVPAEFACY